MCLFRYIPVYNKRIITCTVKNFYANLTELLGSPSNRQYYFICHILTANL